MKYMLLLFDAGTWYDADAQDIEDEMQRHMAFARWCEEHGVTIHGGEALHDPSSGITLDRRQGDPVVTDGAFAELKENLGGYYLIQCADLDLAIEAARQCPMGTANEIRPIYEVGA